MADYWILQQARMDYEYNAPQTKQDPSTFEAQVRYFVRRKYTLTLYREGKITPTEDNFSGSNKRVRVVQTNGETAKIQLPPLNVWNDIVADTTGTPKTGVDYLKAPNGLNWKISEYQQQFDPSTNIWKTFVTLNGFWNYYMRITLKKQQIYKETEYKYRFSSSSSISSSSSSSL